MKGERHREAPYGGFPMPFSRTTSAPRRPHRTAIQLSLGIAAACNFCTKTIRTAHYSHIFSQALPTPSTLFFRTRLHRAAHTGLPYNFHSIFPPPVTFAPRPNRYPILFANRVRTGLSTLNTTKKDRPERWQYSPPRRPFFCG